jgi:hypothetical protein
MKELKNLRILHIFLTEHPPHPEWRITKITLPDGTVIVPGMEQGSVTGQRANQVR